MNTEVVIIGGGPNGLMLACELGLAGVRTIVLDSMPGPSDQPKANGVVGQAVLALDRRGLYATLAETDDPPSPFPGYMFAAMPLRLDLLGPDNPMYGLPVPQARLVDVLSTRARELGADIRWNHEVVAVATTEHAATVDALGPDGPLELVAAYAVGADGAHSLTRKQAGIGFPGVSYDRSTTRAANVTVPESWHDPDTGGLAVPGHGVIPPFLGLRTEHGLFNYAPFPGHAALIATTEWDQPAPSPMSLQEMRASVGRVLGVELPLDEPAGPGPHVLRRRHGGNNRVAESFRRGRVFLLGDAAHVDAAGGQGLNLGLQDAANLGWKLAAALRGDAPDGLLDSYDSERQLAVERVHLYAHAINALFAPGADVSALRKLFGELLTDRSTVQRLAELTAGADIQYEMGGDSDHPLVGRFVPDLGLLIDGKATRLAELSRTGRPLLLDFTENALFLDRLSSGWPDIVGIVELVEAKPLSADPMATAVLIRPDGYAAWASASAQPNHEDIGDLLDATIRWFDQRSANINGLVNL